MNDTPIFKEQEQEDPIEDLLRLWAIASSLIDFPPPPKPPDISDEQWKQMIEQAKAEGV